MASYNTFTLRSLLVLILLSLIHSTARTQDLKELLRKADSTKKALLEQLEEPAPSAEKDLPDIAYEPEKLLWQTVHVPHARFSIPRQSNYDLNPEYLSLITFHSGLGEAPTNALCNIGVMSKEEFTDEFRSTVLSTCEACESQPLPSAWHAELAARNGKYIEYVKPRDYMAFTAYGDINEDSIFVLSVRSRTSDNFKQTTPEILKYVLSQVKILDDYGPYGKEYNLESEIESQLVPLQSQSDFNKKSETYMARHSSGDIYVAGVVNNNTHIKRFSGDGFSRPASMTKKLENSRMRDLIATNRGFAGLLIEDVPGGQLMFLAHFDKTGNQIFKTRLIETAKIQKVGDMEIWDGYDSHKLAQIDDRFVAFISIRKRWESGFASTVYNPNSACTGNGIHQADALITVDASGNIEYDEQSEQANSRSGGSGGFTVSSGSGRGGSQSSEPRLKYGIWWGSSHSFTKDLLIMNDHAVKMTVNDGFPYIGMAASLNDLNDEYKFESTYYDPYYENLKGSRFSKMTNCRSQKGANYVDGLMAGNIHADAEQVYASYAKASDPNGKEIFPKRVGGIYDANYHTKDVYFNDRNLTNTPDLLETNVKSIPMGEYFLITWNVFPENPEAGQPQDQLLFVDQNGNAISEIGDVPTRFFTDASANRQQGYFLYHHRQPVYHGSDLVKLDEYTALWSRVLPETGEVEFVTIELPEELRSYH